MKINKQNSKGITLIALVITIIVLLILAGVTINALTGDNGLLNQTKKSKEQTEIAKEKEQVELAVDAARLSDLKRRILRDNLHTELDRNIGDGEYTLHKEANEFVVTYKSSKRAYKVDSEGGVELYTIDNSQYDKLPDDFWIVSYETAKTATINPTLALSNETTRTATINPTYLEEISTPSYYSSTTTTVYSCDYTKLIVPTTAKVINEDGTTTEVSVTNFSIEGVNNIEYLKISEGFETLPSFKGMNKLKEIIIPSSITTIASDTFDSSWRGTIKILRAEGEIAGKPWGAVNAPIEWND